MTCHQLDSLQSCVPVFLSQVLSSSTGLSPPSWGVFLEDLRHVRCEAVRSQGLNPHEAARVVTISDTSRWWTGEKRGRIDIDSDVSALDRAWSESDKVGGVRVSALDNDIIHRREGTACDLCVVS